MKHKFLETGKIVSTHGVRGEVKVLPWADSPEFLTRFKTFYLVKHSPSGEDGTVVKAAPDEVCADALAVESCRVQNTVVLVKFRGIDTVEEAQKLRDRVISIARDDPHIPAGTVFQADLIGLPVFADGAEIGKIKEILTMPASDVLVVRGKRSYMIPNVKAFVPTLDPALGRVDVNLIEGMETDGE
ncbi:MAG: 16S rRNA processing protein RimM [Oscillospiraceae bacterium]|nr:16S rRNA processing protein RimM [Oscillospiraceae bacterium]